MPHWGDCHWGDFLWGTGGCNPTPPSTDAMVKWYMLVDWSGNGYSGDNEADYCIGMKSKRGREYYVASKASKLTAMSVGYATLTMDNSDGRYDPYNLSSPLYPNVKPGRKIKIYVKEVDAGTTHRVLTGFIDDIKPNSGKDKLVTISVKDGMQWLADQDVDMPTILHSTIAGAITAVLNKANYPFGKSVGAWAQPIPIFDGAKYNSADTLNDLAEAGLGNFFVAADGTAKFYPLNYNSQGSTTLDMAVLEKEIQVSAPWENQRNTIKVNARRRGQYPIAVIWSGTASLAAHSTIKMTINYDAAIGVLSHLYRTRDYQANSSSDGTGAILTDHCIVTIANITSTSAELTIMNFTDWFMYVLNIQVWGCKIVEIGVAFSDTDAASIPPVRRFEIDNPWLQDSGYARAFATLLKDFLKAPQKNPVIQLDQQYTIQYDMDLLDNIPLTIAARGINATFRVGGIEHEWMTQNGQSVHTILYLQKVIYSTATITSDPYYPPAVPPVTPPYDPTTPPVDPTPEPDTPPGDTTCYTDVNAATNGPYVLNIYGDMYSNTASDEKSGDYNCMIRSAAAANKTTLVINGKFLTTDDNGGNWTPLLDVDGLVVDALNGNTVIDTASVQSLPENGVGTLSAVFSAASASEVTRFRVRIIGGEEIWYIYGSPINHGPIPVASDHGQALLDNADGDFESPNGHVLETAALYAVQGKTGTGPWYYSTFDTALGINPQYGIQEGVIIPPGPRFIVHIDDSGAYGCAITYTADAESARAYKASWGGCYPWVIFGTNDTVPAGSTVSFTDLTDHVSAELFVGVEGNMVNYGKIAYNHGPDYVIPTDFDRVEIACWNGGNGTVDVTFQVLGIEVLLFGDGLYKDTEVVYPQERIYFEASTGGDDDYVRVLDTPGEFANNGGAIDFELYHAGQSGNIHLSIDSVLLYNICTPD